MGNRKRLTAFLLTAVMILTMPQMQIAAAEVESPADVGLCIHHTQHTEIKSKENFYFKNFFVSPFGISTVRENT